jgi:TIGR03009 family protein
MDALLAQWEQVSQQNETLYARFTRTDRSPSLVVPRVFEGQALLRKPNLACLEFSEVVPDRSKPVFEQRIVCSGDRVYQFLGPTKQAFVYLLADDERRRSVEEGPLPFLFNMRVARAKQRYTWELVKEQEAQPGQPAKPAAYIIRITPREEIDREEFKMALIMLNMETFLPEALQLYAPNGKDTKTFVFKNVERNGTQNPASNANNFDGERMTEKFQAQGYKVIVNPEGNGAQQAVAQDSPARSRTAQPLQRTATPKSGRPR